MDSYIFITIYRKLTKMLPVAATIHCDNLVHCHAGHEWTQDLQGVSLQIIRAAAAATAAAAAATAAAVCEIFLFLLVRASSLLRHRAVDGAAVYPRVLF
jgi:hypothetical protein